MTANPNRILWIIMGGLLAWGLLLAAGTVLFPDGPGGIRGRIILACTIVFVAFWGLMLRYRHRRLRQEEPKSVEFPPPGT